MPDRQGPGPQNGSGFVGDSSMNAASSAPPSPPSKDPTLVHQSQQQAQQHDHHLHLPATRRVAFYRRRSSRLASYTKPAPTRRASRRAQFITFSIRGIVSVHSTCFEHRRRRRRRAARARRSRLAFGRGIDTPIITEAKMARTRSADLGGNITPGEASDSTAPRRYPRRAQVVKDYNLAHLFEENILRQLNAAPAAPKVYAKPKKQKLTLPVVEASAAFFEALRSMKASKVEVPSNFADFLMAKAKASATAAATLAESGSIANATRSTHAEAQNRLTEAQARTSLRDDSNRLHYGISSCPQR